MGGPSRGGPPAFPGGNLQSILIHVRRAITSADALIFAGILLCAVVALWIIDAVLGAILEAAKKDKDRHE